jgi:hypothetical protein
MEALALAMEALDRYTRYGDQTCGIGGKVGEDFPPPRWIMFAECEIVVLVMRVSKTFQEIK